MYIVYTENSLRDLKRVFNYIVIGHNLLYRTK